MHLLLNNLAQYRHHPDINIVDHLKFDATFLSNVTNSKMLITHLPGQIFL